MTFCENGNDVRRVSFGRTGLPSWMSGTWIYGAIPPEPAGGVSTFVERLVHHHSDLIAGVIDPYWGEKRRIPVEHITPRAPGLLCRIGTLLRLLQLRRKTLLVNASTPRALTLLFPFLIFRRADTLLILHHGRLKVTWAMGGACLFRWLARKYARIGCLSDDQFEFYLSHGIDPAKLVRLKSYLAPVHVEVAHTKALLQSTLSWIAKPGGKLIVSSGYAEDLYHHDWLLRAVIENDAMKEARCIVCCYGPKTAILTALQHQAAASQRCRVVYGLNPAEFDVVLSKADVYVRPTDTDSVGIATWDAAARGVTVVASGACRRPPGSFLHSCGDEEGFVYSLIAALNATEVSESGYSEDAASLVNVGAFIDPQHPWDVTYDCNR